MALSAPIFQLKRTAKSLSRTAQIPLNEALDNVAEREGFSSWSELSSSPSALSSPTRLFTELELGDLLLLGGRPRQGKTAMALKLIVEAMKQGHKGVFFTLEYNEQDVAALFTKIGIKSKKFDGLFELNNSDNIDAPYIIQQMKFASSGTVLAIDYLQILDQRRQSPVISDQVKALKSFARERGLIVIFVSQIDRSFELSTRMFPEMRDIRLPNRLDLSVFDKACFIKGGEMRMQTVGA